ncbi:uncharacterized protein BDR25DRAFT_355760 [Lindgomyces ingoldianus]|uniref:Uncharacterized protein n=1 Tax=Lindgomyces ingoldianus TaxID=673940 RepID=A0ACB6QT14_9PLEO|nr:uncharacterized protein BDR25DRAFT_355760 [Lindgomyces ingoldianus]KAF2470036.1 hypothetical protein BDR25DRAFT_355760 [Lindgomyces ingoldianus]
MNDMDDQHMCSMFRVLKSEVDALYRNSTTSDASHSDGTPTGANSASRLCSVEAFCFDPYLSVRAVLVRESVVMAIPVSRPSYSPKSYETKNVMAAASLFTFIVHGTLIGYPCLRMRYPRRILTPKHNLRMSAINDSRVPKQPIGWGQDHYAQPRAAPLSDRSSISAAQPGNPASGPPHVNCLGICSREHPKVHKREAGGCEIAMMHRSLGHWFVKPDLDIKMQDEHGYLEVSDKMRGEYRGGHNKALYFE